MPQDSDRHLVFRTGVIYNFERSFSVGAIEVATTMISEVAKPASQPFKLFSFAQYFWGGAI